EDAVPARSFDEPTRVREVEHAFVGSKSGALGGRKGVAPRVAATRHGLLAELDPEVTRAVDVTAQRRRIVAGVGIGADCDLGPDQRPQSPEPVDLCLDVTAELDLERAKA